MVRTGDHAGPEISVTMEGGRVVIRPSGRLDGDGVETVRGLLAGARAAGASAVLDLSLMDRGDRPAVLTALRLTAAVSPPVAVA